jgi:hypothetical protein
VASRKDREQIACANCPAQGLNIESSDLSLQFDNLHFDHLEDPIVLLARTW